MTDTVSKSSSGNWQHRLSKTVFWILLFRGFLVIALGFGLLMNPTKTETLLLNFMGFFWLISGVTLLLRTNTGLGKRMSLIIGLVGTLTGLIVIGRNIIGAWLTEILLFEVLGAVILLTGVVHIMSEVKIRVRTPRRQTAYHFLLGVFEFIMGAMLLLSAFEAGSRIYWLATIWALIGGALILSQALYLRAQKHVQ
jgi:uncharacterized membrane protein HdeD (DUF308 family)